MMRAPVGLILVGMSSYGLRLTTVRAAVMVTAAWLLGGHVSWSGLLPGLLILALLVAAHWGIQNCDFSQKNVTP